MAGRKSQKSKSTGLGMGLDALIKAKTREETNETEEEQLKTVSEEIETSKDVDDNNTSDLSESKPVKPNSSKTKTQISKFQDNSSSPNRKSSKSSISKSNPSSNDKTGSDDYETQRITAVTNDVKKNPRITLWSSRSAAVLRYLKKTQPEFSISKEASKLIEEAVKEKYPEIWDHFDDL